MLRVLHLIDSLGPGGIETWLLRMVKAMPREQFAMDFFCKRKSDRGYVEKAQQLGAKVHFQPLCADHVRFVRGLTEILKRGKYDIVHNHLDYAAAPGVWTSRRLGVPVVSTIHNTTFAPLTWTRMPGVRQMREIYGRRSLAYTLKNSTIVSGVSRGVLDRVSPGHESNDRFRVMYLGVEAWGKADQETREQFRCELGLAPNTPLVLHVGRFANQKNHQGLLRIFKRVRKRMPDARLLLVGDGPLRAEVQRAISSHTLGDAVDCLGQRDDIPLIMGCADVFLLPSFHEGFPVVCLEAAGAELPVVGSDIPGLNEAVLHGRTGLLHSVDDESAMAASVVRILSDASLAASFRVAGAERINDDLSSQAVALRLTNLYTDALQIAHMPSSKRLAA